MTPQVTLKISAKELDQKINYINPIQHINLNKKNEKLDFLLANIEKEVKQLTIQQKKRYAKILKSTLITTSSLLLFVTPTLAATPITPPSPDIIMPQDILKFGAWVIGICCSLGFLLATVCYQLAGGMRILRKRKEANDWTVDIIKGFTQLMLAPVIVGLIAIVCYMLFRNFTWFVSPF